MSVEDCNVVDVVSIDKQDGAVILTVSDHLEWSNSRAHQEILQAKLNRYLAFVEGGELLERYPNAKGRPVTIKVVLKYRPDADGRKFLSRAGGVVASAGIGFRHEVFAESYDN
ncbi:MAG: DUF6572 domain-containing protein [Candidatus Sulfotelmatobacter sp.]